MAYPESVSDHAKVLADYALTLVGDDKAQAVVFETLRQARRGDLRTVSADDGRYLMHPPSRRCSVRTARTPWHRPRGRTCHGQTS